MHELRRFSGMVLHVFVGSRFGFILPATDLPYGDK